MLTGQILGRSSPALDIVLKESVLRKWLKAFVAVVIGNAVYFLVLLPYLPPIGRHRPNQLDWGLLVDFWVCLAMYGLVDLGTRKLQSKSHS